MEVITELMQRTQTFLCLPDKNRVCLKCAETHRIVDVADRDVMLAKCLTPKNVFISIMVKTLVKMIGEY